MMWLARANYIKVDKISFAVSHRDFLFKLTVSVFISKERGELFFFSLWAHDEWNGALAFFFPP